VASLTIQTSVLGTQLQTLLMADDIVPGKQPSYQLCKTIYLYHPLGAKIAEKPVRIAQSQKRKIAVQDTPGDRWKEQFEKTWIKMGADKTIFACRVQSRMYGIASMAVLVGGESVSEALDLEKIWNKRVSFNVYDPLNTAGSLMLIQDPLSQEFQHAQEIRVDGKTFHRSRARVIMNEFPIYIDYTSSGFGFVGRSCYQRGLYPLKSYVQTMVTNDMVSLKAGTLVAKIKQAGSVITGAMQTMFGMKRNVVKEAVTGNVISIGTDGEEIQSIDLTNIAEPLKLARHNIIEDIASATPMPAKMLTEESFAEGFGEGTEDAKEQARYVDGEREHMDPLYEFMDTICMRLAWTPEFYATMQKEFPEEYKGLDFNAAFYRARNTFKAEWPSLLTEPESELIKVADVKLRALVAVLQVLMPLLQGEELATTIQWVADNMNEMKLLFGSPLNLDTQAIADYKEQKEADEAEAAENALKEPSAPKPFSKADSSEQAINDLRAAVERLATQRRPLKVAHAA
jgi:hypothetical protein